MKSRRRFLDTLARAGVGGATAQLLSACGSMATSTAQQKGQLPAPSEHFDLIVIGTGFGGSMTALHVAYTLDGIARRPPAAPLRILMLERGTWWTTPVETVQDKQVKTRDFLILKGQPTQEWSSLNDYRGMFDLTNRCRYSEKRPQGLYEFTPIGKRGFLSLTNDGVSVLRASGVGGGSLIYSKILIRPPETLFDDPRWPGGWQGRAGASERREYYQKALEAVTHGVEALVPKYANDATGLTGPSNILTRTAPTPVQAFETTDPLIPATDGKRRLLRIRIKDQSDTPRLEGREAELLDRARVFQTAIAKLTPHYGTADLSINDMDAPLATDTAKPPAPRDRRPDPRRPTPAASDSREASLKQPGTNYCERHGRCNIGCLPGAGQTLNKQIMRAIWGTPNFATLDPKVPDSGACRLTRVALQLRALAQVSHVSETGPNGPYLVHYRQLRVEDPTLAGQDMVISADRVIVAASSLGTSELMLRSRQRSADTGRVEGLHSLSDKLGYGFSPNGDHIALLEHTRERVNLSTGPVTTSFGQFKPDAPQANGFHNVEDQGIPRSLASLAGYGFDTMRRLAHDDGVERYTHALFGSIEALHDIRAGSTPRSYPALGPADLSADRTESEDELPARMMCVVAQGKDAANGQFRLENDRLRVEREDKLPFHQDPIYTAIRSTLDELAKELRPQGSGATFIAPLVDAVPPGSQPTVLTSHPLGGCRMAETVDQGVVDEWGRVFRMDGGSRATYKGLYIADGSVIPTALGVNPALTISAVSLRVAKKVLDEWDEIASSSVGGMTSLQCTTSA